MTLEGVVFDFDGVIANSEPLHLRVYQTLLAQEGLPFSASEYYERYLGIDDVGVFEALARDKGLDIAGDRMAGLVARKTEIFLRLVRDGQVLFDGAADCMTTVAAAVPVAIASGALRHEIEQILDGAGLRALVPVIIAAGETPRGKPAPDPYAAAVEQMSPALPAGRSIPRVWSPSRIRGRGCSRRVPPGCERSGWPPAIRPAPGRGRTRARRHLAGDAGAARCAGRQRPGRCRCEVR